MLSHLNAQLRVRESPAWTPPRVPSRNDVLRAADALLCTLLWRDLDLRVEAQACLDRLHANIVATAKASRALRHAFPRPRPLVLLVQAHGPLDDQELLVSCNHRAIQRLQTVAAVTTAEDVSVPPGVPEDRIVLDVPLLLAHAASGREGRIETDAFWRTIHRWALALRCLIHLKIEARTETIIAHQRRRVASRLLGQVLDVGTAQRVLPVSPTTASTANVNEPFVLRDQVRSLKVRGGLYQACHPYGSLVDVSPGWMHVRG